MYFLSLILRILRFDAKHKKLVFFLCFCVFFLFLYVFLCLFMSFYEELFNILDEKNERILWLISIASIIHIVLRDPKTLRMLTEVLS